MKEIREKINSDKDISDESVKSLNYLDCIIYETLRI